MDSLKKIIETMNEGGETAAGNAAAAEAAAGGVRGGAAAAGSASSSPSGIHRVARTTDSAANSTVILPTLTVDIVYADGTNPCGCKAPTTKGGEGERDRIRKSDGEEDKSWRLPCPP